MEVMRSDHTKTVRRWHQYSMRTLMIVVTILALPCSWFAVKMRQAERQRHVATTIKKLGGAVYYDFQYDCSSMRVKKKTSAVPAWLRNCLGVDFFSDIVCVSAKNLTYDDLLQLQSLPYLKVLSINNTAIKQEDFVPISKLTEPQNAQPEAEKDTRQEDKARSMFKNQIAGDLEAKDLGITVKSGPVWALNMALKVIDRKAVQGPLRYIVEVVQKEEEWLIRIRYYPTPFLGSVIRARVKVNGEVDFE